LTSEVRRIRFSLAETEVAAAGFARREGLLGDDLRVCGARLGDQPEATVVLELKRGDAPAEPLKLARAQVTEALIRFCLDRGIPLPQDGRKVLLTEMDSAVLTVTLSDLSGGHPHVRLVK
jgi:hypothetical protein